MFHYKKIIIFQILIFGLSIICGMKAVAQEEAPTDENPDAEANPEEASEKEKTPPPPRAKILTKAEIEKRQQIVIAENIDDGEVVWLNANGEEFLALWQEELKGKPYGAVLMLHHTGQTVDWPRTLKNMRQNLSEHGWSTLSISLPAPNPKEVPKRTFPKLPKKAPKEENSEDGEAGDNGEGGAEESKDKEVPPATEEAPSGEGNAEQESKQSSEEMAPKEEERKPPEPVEPVAEARISAAMQFLYDKKQFNIALLGDGLGASRGARYAHRSVNSEMSKQLAKMPEGGVVDKPFQAIVLLNALNTMDEDNEFNLTDVFQYRDIPVLDIIYYSNPSIQKAFRERAFAAKESKLQTYMQKKILEPNDADSHTTNKKVRARETRTTRIIRGFLNKHARGVEL